MFSLKISRQVQRDVLIIGAGAAGIRTAIALREKGLSPLLVSKREFGDAHTSLASGGINAALGSLDEEDRWEIHAADTLKEGHFINDPKAVETVCKNAPAAVLELQDWGCPFNTTDDGKINQRFFGAQSFRRTCFVGDKTGRAVLDTLVNKAKKMEIPCEDAVYIFQVVKEGGKVIGALAIDKKKEEVILYKASFVVLAAGGYAAIYQRSSSRPDENLGDAVHLAYQAGVKLMDMEMLQFHPTGMVQPEEYKGKLVTEAVRGEGGHLLNKDRERFMKEYSPEKKELDARDVVTRAITREILKGNGTENNAVCLDISHKDKDFLKSRLPKMYDRFKELDIDISEEPMEVAPTSHYSMGGAVVNFETGATDVPGLYAVGEAASGLHGGNRLGGNSLIETLVLGKLTGEHIAGKFESASRELDSGAINKMEQDFRNRAWHQNPTEVIREIQELMWEHAGVLRSDEGLATGLEKLANIKERIASDSAPGAEPELDLVWQNLDLEHVILASELVLKTARYRKESRGAHFREDYQEEDPDWKLNILCQQDENGELRLETRKPGKISQEVEKAVEENHSLDYHPLE